MSRDGDGRRCSRGSRGLQTADRDRRRACARERRGRGRWLLIQSRLGPLCREVKRLRALTNLHITWVLKVPVIYPESSPPISRRKYVRLFQGVQVSRRAVGVRLPRRDRPLGFGLNERDGAEGVGGQARAGWTSHPRPGRAGLDTHDLGESAPRSRPSPGSPRALWGRAGGSSGSSRRGWRGCSGGGEARDTLAGWWPDS